MQFVDFHTHLDSYKNSLELKNQILNFDGILVSASMDKNSYEKNLKLKAEVEKLNSKAKIICTFGIHPSNAEKKLENLLAYSEILQESKIIGEIGMDFCWHKDISPLAQEKVFRFFLEHCDLEKKYCVIHTKDAEEKICRILEDYKNAKPIIHWFDGSEDVFDEFIRRNYMQTFGCQTIRSKHIQKLLSKTPLNLILAETDNPDSEIWLGGKDDSIFLIKRIYTDLAKILNLDFAKMAEIINQNSLRVLQNLAV